jgi:thiol-disulfide isomerase/thioredoxin
MRRGPVVVAVLVAALTGCAAPTPLAEVASPLRACPVTASNPPPSTGPGRTIPALTLPCFTGGTPVALAGLGRPAVISLWSSTCEPCRTELPELQRFADATSEVTVLGVVTGDQRSRAASLATDLAIRFPSVDDPDLRLLNNLGRGALPVTLFVDATGVIRHEDVTGAMTYERLRDLAGRHLATS